MCGLTVTVVVVGHSLGVSLGMCYWLSIENVFLFSIEMFFCLMLYDMIHTYIKCYSTLMPLIYIGKQMWQRT